MTTNPISYSNEPKIGREYLNDILELLCYLSELAPEIDYLAKLQATFDQEEVDLILKNVVDHISRNQCDFFEGYKILNFIALCGYRLEPQVDKDGGTQLRRTTALHVLAKYKYNVEMNHLIVPLLFEVYRDDLNYTDESGITHFHVACMYSCGKKFAEKFLELGQDPNLLVKSTGDTPLHMSLSCTFCLSLVELLLAKGANPNVANKLGRTPLQLAVSNLMAYEVDLLLDHGANPSDFVFPASNRFEACIESLYGKKIRHIDKLSIASSAMRIVESLEKRGYELDRSDALTIMKCFAKWELFEKSVDVEKRLYSDNKFTSAAKEIMVKPDLSLYDLLQLRPKEAAKLVTYCDFFHLSSLDGFDCLPKGPRNYCITHLCEKLSRKFFLDWALDPFIELIDYRLPILCCEMIMENLTNEDLYNICLAATGPTDKDGVEDVITNVIKCNNKRPSESEGREAPKKAKI